VQTRIQQNEQDEAGRKVDAGIQQNEQPAARVQAPAGEAGSHAACNARQASKEKRADRTREDIVGAEAEIHGNKNSKHLQGERGNNGGKNSPLRHSRPEVLAPVACQTQLQQN